MGEWFIINLQEDGDCGFCVWAWYTGREVGYVSFVWVLGICDLVSCCDAVSYREGREGVSLLFYLVGISFSTALSWWEMGLIWNLGFGNWDFKALIYLGRSGRNQKNLSADFTDYAD